MSSPVKPRIAVTTGDPAGIGPDIILAIGDREFDADIIVLGSSALLLQRAAELGTQIDVQRFEADTTMQYKPGRLYCIEQPLQAQVQTGQSDAVNAPYVMGCIKRAVEGCLSGQFSAMVTAPVNKAMLNDGGYHFTGHTEFIADLSAAPLPVMMLANNKLRVALATTHLPLAKVPAAINRDKLEQVISIVHNELREKFGIKKPQVLVCGLNPHAGEQGYLGVEEIEIIEPVLAKLCQSGIHLRGPVPADTAFTQASLQGIDAVIAMYHDQGLPVLKAMGFGEIVNITLGLPIIRTSVDHGTALELAGTGKADASSLLAAIEYASSLCRSGH